MYLLYLAGTKAIPASVSITADTGWENDCDLMDGSKISGREFFEQHITPFAQSLNIDAFYVRSVDKNKNPLPDLRIHALGDIPRDIPVFGGNGGRQMQSCTSKWKIAAMDQQSRRLGAKTARSAQGILFSERARRVKGSYLGQEGGFDIYQPTTVRKGVSTPVKWKSHYYPLVDLQMNRDDVRFECDRLGIPYLISSECEGCPHADPARWLRREPETIEYLAKAEERWDGEFFFTQQRRPLREVIAEFRASKDNQFTLFDTADCTDGVCFT
jgi:hypothetical protein